ncbi:hypothetical protein BJX70DRAFT_378294 [Aspergillus crustosus]
MGKNKGAARALTQEEIWDDSALVQSWDDAVDEYKLYHSINAKGENVEDVLRAAEAEAAAEAQAGEAAAGSWAQVKKDDDMADVYDAEPASETQAPQTVSTSAPVKQETPAAAAPQASPPPPPAFPPVHDEGLRSLMMAWYYAGYYTGLYEGQQQRCQNHKKS